MKKIFFSLILLYFVFVPVSCNREEEPVEAVATPAVSDPAVNYFDPEAIDIYSVKTYSQEEYVNFVGESFDDYLGFLYSPDLNVVVKRLATKIFDRNKFAVDKAVADELGCLRCRANSKWSVKVINFAYTSVSYTGEQIRLSAALCFPVLNDPEIKHALSAMSLCPPHMPIDKEFCPTMNGSILMARVAFNHAVVVPDYQGRGITSSKPYSSLHTHDHAMQAIHAALAAKIILAKEGVTFAEDAGLYNVGVSEGGETAYEAHKIIENDIPDDQRSELNLKLSFCANGIAQHAKYVRTQMGIFEYVDENSFIAQMDFYGDVFDCFSETEKQGFARSDLYSDSLLDANGKIILDSPIINVLSQGVARNDIDFNWNPKHPIAVAGSVDDNDVLYVDNALYMYNLIKNTPEGQVNTNASLLTFDTPVSSVVSGYLGPDLMFAHIAADVCCFVHAIRFENPGEHRIITSIFSDEGSIEPEPTITK